MKKINIITSILLLAITVSSCNKLLDIKPVNSMIPVSISDYESVLMGGYPKTDFFMKTDLMTDNVYANLSSTRTPEKANEPWFAWSEIKQLDGVEEDPYWGQLYKSIYCANTVLDEFASRTPSPAEKDLFETVKGEAFALRAFSYFYLVNLYAEPYAPTTLKAHGVPMPLSAKDVHQNTQNNVREPVEKVWAQILSDLDAATPLLAGKKTTNKFRFDATSLQLFKARVHLFMGDYEKAIAAASDIIVAKPLFDMNNIQAIVDKADHPSYAFSGTFGFVDSDYKNEVLFYVGGKANGNIFYYGTYMFKPSLELLALCQRPNKMDYRQYIFASLMDTNTPEGFETGTTIYNMYAKQENPSYYIGMKVSEAYVTRAEAYARLKQKDKALTDINNLLQKRIKKTDYVPLKSADFNDEQLLQRVLEERRVEMAFDGGMRWFDLRRLGKPALTHLYKNGVEYKLKQGDPRYLLQIPLSEQTNSPDMLLNP